MSTALTNRERAHLKARAHALEPVVHIGNAGVTDTLVAEVDRALTAHELIKVKVGTDDRADRVASAMRICARTGATAVHRVGKVVILWRPRPAIRRRSHRGSDVRKNRRSGDQERSVFTDPPDRPEC